MCGRFMLDSDIENILSQYKILKNKAGAYNKGDIYPSESIPIVMEGNNLRVLQLTKWGFPLSEKNKLVINARSESIVEKPMFRNLYFSGRCIIPASLFYEWKDEGNRKKTKHKIYLQNQSTASLGGILKYSLNDKGEKELSFVIITTEANKYMKDIHSRMPLIIDSESYDYWLDSKTSIDIIDEIVKSNVNHRLIIERDSEVEPFEQMKLF
ncbi:MAG: SOS response-associated peptidase [Tissierella sp.]|nr:SOS response-associated peptidase [Tissierella sp.]